MLLFDVSAFYSILNVKMQFLQQTLLNKDIISLKDFNWKTG